jgi:signal transduction histidine kinase
MKKQQLCTMVQLIDVSSSVKYDQQIAANKLLSMINACISHELRNPLNSILAQNMEKEHLYKELQQIIRDCRNQISAETFGKLETLILRL